MTKISWIKVTAVWAMLALCLTGLSVNFASAQAGLDVSVTQRGNMREGPGTDFDVITLLRVGTAVRLDGRDQSGAWVRGFSSQGFFGWMSSGLFNLSTGNLSNLPIIEPGAPVLISPPSAGAGSSGGGGTSNINLANGFPTTATNNVNVRSGPGTDFRRVGGLNFEQTFVMDGRDSTGNWARGVTPTGEIGWVSTSFLDLTREELIALPVVDPNSDFGLGGGSSGGSTANNDPVPAPNNPPVVNNAPITGFSYGGHVQNINGRSINAMNQAGMTWIKKQVRVGSGGTGFISQAQSAGFRILLGVVGDRNRVNDDGYLQSYASFVAGLARAGADAIEVWNEPNIDREWITGDINPERYTEMLRIAYNAIKSANPNTLVISGAPAPTGAEGAFPGAVMNDDRYVQRMAAAGAANYMDCIGIHYNEGIVPPSQVSGDPRGDYYTRYLRSMIDVYYNAFGGARPLCFTELGYLTPEGYGGLPGAFAWASNVTIAQQAAWLRQAIDISRSSGRVRLVIVWNVDFQNFGNDPMAGYAMIRTDGSCPACAALGGG